MPRCSAPDWCFFRDTYVPADYYRQLKTAGISAVELVNDPVRRAAARAIGLPVLSLSGRGMQQGINRLANHETLLPEIRQVIGTAKAEGIPMVVALSGNRDELSDAEGIANCVTALRQLAPVAEDAGVTLAFEMLCAQNHPGYHADRSAFGFAVVEQVASPAVKVLYDIYHMFRMGEDVLGDILGHLDQIVHLHVADSPRRSVPTIDGEIDYRNIYRIVQAAGYTGYWGLEFVPGEDAMAEVHAACALLTDE